MTVRFVAPDARIPVELRTPRASLRPLRASDAELDHEAVMASAARLRRWSGGVWPADDFSIEANRADLARHQREHDERVAFTFTVMDPAAAAPRCLGCVYLAPMSDAIAACCPDAASGAEVGFWVRASEEAAALDAHLLAALRAWLAADWPFDAVVWTTSQLDAERAALFAGAGLTLLPAATGRDGRPCFAYG